jgi:hypothetical protein
LVQQRDQELAQQVEAMKAQLVEALKERNQLWQLQQELQQQERHMLAMLQSEKQ